MIRYIQIGFQPLINCQTKTKMYFYTTKIRSYYWVSLTRKSLVYKWDRRYSKHGYGYCMDAFARATRRIRGIKKMSWDKRCDSCIYYQSDKNCYKRSGTESGMSNDQKKHIDAFKYWVQTNTENGVSTIPKSICDNVIRIMDGEDGGADGGD